MTAEFKRIRWLEDDLKHLKEAFGAQEVENRCP